MDDPLMTQWHLFGVDAGYGVFEAQGFKKEVHPGVKVVKAASVFTNGLMGFHAMGFWQHFRKGVFYYHRGPFGSHVGSVFGVGSFCLPPAKPDDWKEISWDEGYSCFLPVILKHEIWIMKNKESSYRKKGLVKVPPDMPIRFVDAWRAQIWNKARRIFERVAHAS